MWQYGWIECYFMLLNQLTNSFLRFVGICWIFSLILINNAKRWLKVIESIWVSLLYHDQFYWAHHFVFPIFLHKARIVFRFVRGHCNIYRTTAGSVITSVSNHFPIPHATSVGISKLGQCIVASMTLGGHWCQSQEVWLSDLNAVDRGQLWSQKGWLWLQRWILV